MKTLAAILHTLNEPLALEQIEIPKLDVGQVLVEIHKSGICGAQLGEISGVKGPDKFLPHLLGHEGGGIVREIGPGVTQVQPGDHVVLHWRKGPGINARSPQYKMGDKTVNAGWVTTFCEQAIISENRLTKISPTVNFEVAALMGCAVTTAIGLLSYDAKLKIGESVAVFGCGGVGLGVIQAAALGGAYPIIGIDIQPEKLELAKKFGATHVLNSKEDISTSFKAIVGPSGCDIFVETTGHVRLIEQAYKLTASKGRVILVGVPKHDQDITIHSLPLHFGKVLTGCEGGQTAPERDIPRYLKLCDAGKLDVLSLITHRFPLSDVNKALDVVRSGKSGRVILNCSSGS